MDDLKLIKKHYGENMMHLCRELFPTLLETPGLLFETISKHFAYSRLLYDDIVNMDYVDDFKNFIYQNSNIETDKKAEESKTPEELLDEAGYILYECKSEKDIQSFRHFYHRSDGTPTPVYVEGTKPETYKLPEELCTFGGGRLVRCHVFFAVKKNVNEIKRDNFPEPKRQDKYGTSVISIQFTRGKTNTLSIKNRWNHVVNNPDATFGNNLDNIAEGLTRAFEKKYGFNINSSKSTFELDGYLIGNDGKFYKYNYEIANVYYCPNNVILDNFKPKQYDPSRYIVFDYFVLDLQEKKIKLLEEDLQDSFIDGLNNIQNIEVVNNKKDNTKDIIINKDIVITINKLNQIIKYKNPHLKHIGANFLSRNRVLQKIELPNVEKIEKYFLYHNANLTELNLPKCRKLGSLALGNNKIITKLDLPVCETIGDYVLSDNKCIEIVNLPETQTIGDNFLSDNEIVYEVNLPKVLSIGAAFLSFNQVLEEINLPEVINVGASFLYHNRNSIKKVIMPKLETIASRFLHHNTSLQELDLSSVIEIRDDFLYCNKVLKKINLSNCESIMDCFLYNNEALEELDLSKVKIIGSRFLCHNKILKKLNLSSITNIRDFFLYNNENLEELIIPNIVSMGKDALTRNFKIQKIIAPNITHLEQTEQKNSRLIRALNPELVSKLFDLEEKSIPASKK